MTTLHRRRSCRLLLLLCLLGGTSVPMTQAQAHPWSPESLTNTTNIDNNRRGDRYGDWLSAQRAQAAQSYQQTQHRLDQLERCLSRNTQSQERDQCLRRDLEARQRQWQLEKRDRLLLIRRQGRIAQLLLPFEY